jgi:hypothetical protein
MTGSDIEDDRTTSGSRRGSESHRRARALH